MALVKSNPFGQMSGKLGGVVFSSNKAGQIARAHVVPSNPKTQSQTRARAMFGSVTRIFRTLTATEKTLWQEFADNYFIPRNGTNTGQFSGYNAFQALRSAVQQAYRVPQTGDVSADGTPITKAETEFTPMPETPIAKSFTGAFKDTNDQAQALLIDDATVNEDGSGSVDLQVGDGTGVDLAGLISPEDYVVGLALYLSNGNPQANMTYRNRFSNALGYIKPVDSSTPGTELAGVSVVTYDFDNTYNIGASRRFPLPNEYALLSVFAINKYGMMAEIDNTEVQIVDL